jgi:hypothetical protein
MSLFQTFKLSLFLPYDRFLEHIFAVPVNIAIVSRRASSIVILPECTLINYIFSNRLIPDVIKTGLLSPVYKNKGENHQSKNYRGIGFVFIFEFSI